MKKIELFEPAMCCSTGVCGPSVDQNLLKITAVFNNLSEVEGVASARYNLSQNPQEFETRPDILAEVKKSIDNLPITVVDGEIVKEGSYPTLDEITEYTGLVFVMPENSSSCCGDNSNCC